MKCVCGYEHEKQWNKEDRDYETVKGDEEFIESKLELAYETDGRCYKNLRSSTVYICPKCGTLKIERW